MELCEQGDLNSCIERWVKEGVVVSNEVFFFLFLSFLFIVYISVFILFYLLERTACDENNDPDDGGPRGTAPPPHAAPGPQAAQHIHQQRLRGEDRCVLMLVCVYFIYLISSLFMWNCTMC
jgi:hypothetical protein